MRVYFTLQSDAKKISDNRSFKTRGESDKGQPARKSIGNKIFLKRTRGKMDTRKILNTCSLSC